MTHNSRRTTAWFVILLLAAPGPALAQRGSRLLGKIVDPDGKPIPDVTVTATCPQIPDFKRRLTTDKKGVFIIDFRDIDVTYHYRFEKAGYQPLEVDQEWSLVGTGRFEWTMTPVVVGSAPSGPAPASTSERAVTAFNEGVAAYKLKDLATAERKFLEAVQHDPALGHAWAVLSTLRVQAGRNKEAAEAAEKAMALGLRDETVLTARWQAYRNLKDEAKAADALRELETVGRRTEEARRIHNEGVALLRSGDAAAAFSKFQEAVGVDPTLQPAQLGLATAALKIGRNAEAATAAEAVLKTDPASVQAIRLRYNACLSLGDTDRLFESLVGLSAVEPAVAGKGMVQLAFAAYDANDRVRAKERFLKVLQFEPNQPLVNYYLGLLYLGEGATTEARKYLEHFLALAPDSQEASTARELLDQLRKKP